MPEAHSHFRGDWIFWNKNVRLSSRCIQKYLHINRAISLYLMSYLSFITLLEKFMEFDLRGNQITSTLDVA